MGDIIESESVLIQKRASIQQQLCVHMRAYAGADKKSFIGHASVNDLQKALKLLRSEKARQVKEKKMLSD